MKIITILNQKGGVLKTTLTANLGSAKALEGKRVLLIDMDQSSNLSLMFGIDSKKLKSTLSEVLLDDADVKEAILDGVIPNLDLLPSNKSLKSLIPLVYQRKKPNPVKTLETLLSKMDYDYIFMDSAPELDLLTIAQIKISDEIVIPVQPETLAIKGLASLNEDLKEIASVDTKLLVVPTLVDKRTSLHKNTLPIISKFAKKNGMKVSTDYVSRSIRSATSVAFDRLPIVLKKSKLKNISEYKSIAKQI